MSENTESVRNAAIEMLNGSLDELKRELVVEGAYHVVVEGGYHSELLSDEETDYLATMLVDHGVCALAGIASHDSREHGERNIAQIIPMVNTNTDAFEKIVNRLDGGNHYPEFFLEYDTSTETYTLYESGC